MSCISCMFCIACYLLITSLTPLPTGTTKRLVDRLCGAVLHTTYMGTVNSSRQTRQLAASLAGA